MSLEHSDLDDLDFFPESSAHEMALARWEQRLGGMYDIVAAVAGDERHTRDIVAVTDPVDETTATAAEGDQTCPFTGTKGAACPITGILASASDALTGTVRSADAAPSTKKSVPKDQGGEASESQAEGEKCPWPFVMMHDPVAGHRDHRLKNMALGAALAALLVAQAVPLLLGQRLQ
jgi:hypothetical protein